MVIVEDDRRRSDVGFDGIIPGTDRCNRSRMEQCNVRQGNEHLVRDEQYESILQHDLRDNMELWSNDGQCEYVQRNVQRFHRVHGSICCIDFDQRRS